MIKVAAVGAALILIGVCFYCVVVSQDSEMSDAETENTYLSKAMQDLQEYIDSNGYNSFSAYVTDNDGDKIYGIGVCNDNECYVNYEDGGDSSTDGKIDIIYGAGFIPTDDPEIDANALIGSELYDEYDDETKYIMTFTLGEICTQFVSENTLFVYGINVLGDFYFEEYDLEDLSDDERLQTLMSKSNGKTSLYDYDSDRYLNYVGDSSSFDPVSISKMNYDSAISDINDYLQNQMLGFYTSNVESITDIALEAYKYYLETLDGGTFMGIGYDDLKNYVDGLDNHQFLKITDEGLELSKDKLQMWERILYGGLCVLGCIAAIVLTIVTGGASSIITTMICGALFGAAFGALSETFVEVAIDAEVEVNVTAICISAATGLITGGLTFLSGWTGIAAVSLVSATGNALSALVKTGSYQDALHTFGVGLVVGAAVGCVAKVLSNSINKNVSFIQKHSNKTEVTVYGKAYIDAKKITAQLNKDHISQKLIHTAIQKQFDIAFNNTERYVNAISNIFETGLNITLTKVFTVYAVQKIYAVPDTTERTKLILKGTSLNVDENGNYLDKIIFEADESDINDFIKSGKTITEYTDGGVTLEDSKITFCIKNKNIPTGLDYSQIIVNPDKTDEDSAYVLKNNGDLQTVDIDGHERLVNVVSVCEEENLMGIFREGNYGLSNILTEDHYMNWSYRAGNGVWVDRGIVS